jgi:hypothetical protein
MLAVPVERTAHMLDGCSCCEYTAQAPRAPQPTQSDAPNDAHDNAPEAADARPDQEHA